MEHFRNAKLVRLLSRHNKYLTADEDDEDGVRQHRNMSRGAKWEVEVVEGRTDVIRLKSCCFNRYLAASHKRFLLGATGRRVDLLPLPHKQKPESLGECVEWQPIRDGDRYVKLRTKQDTFLRANGFVKPYGNTVTHGNPHRTVTQDWVLWEVDVVDMVNNPTTDPSPAAADGVVVQQSLSFSSYPFSGVVPAGSIKDQFPSAGVAAVKVLVAAATIKAGSHRPNNSDVSVGSSCVSVDDDECGYTYSPSSSFVDSPGRRRTRSSASSESTSTVPKAPARRSSFSSVSTVSSSPPPSPRPPRPVRIRTPPSPPDSRFTVSSSLPTSARPPPRVRIPSPPPSPGTRSTVSSSPPTSPGGPPSPRVVFPALSRRKSSLEGRQVHYYFADDDGEVDDSFGGGSLEFHGSTAKELINHVEKATGVDNFILCTRSVIDDRLHRLSLVLPLTPNRAPMTVFIVHPNSKVARRFA